MFDLIKTEETSRILGNIKKELRKKDYKEVKSRTNRYIGTMHLNYKTTYFIKNNLMFEFEENLESNTIKVRFKHKWKGNTEYKEIRLADVLSMT